MPYLLDTVVLSELRKKSKAAAPVIAWQNAAAGQLAFVSVVTIHEIHYGRLMVERRDPAFAQRLDTWYQEILAARGLYVILPIDLTAAETAADFRARHGTAFADSLIAATAQVNGLTLATRNISDFEGTGVAVVNPWEF
jgi:predicted nucleic acid-binding protein